MWANTGSPIQPRASEAIVMPNCVVAVEIAEESQKSAGLSAARLGEHLDSRAPHAHERKLRRDEKAVC
jgi:tartrate dehydratase alpha subunit/fumarate hydratase class I-like protein